MYQRLNNPLKSLGLFFQSVDLYYLRENQNTAENTFVKIYHARIWNWIAVKPRHNFYILLSQIRVRKAIVPPKLGRKSEIQLVGDSNAEINTDSKLYELFWVMKHLIYFNSETCKIFQLFYVWWIDYVNKVMEKGVHEESDSIFKTIAGAFFSNSIWLICKWIPHITINVEEYFFKQIMLLFFAK